MIVLGMKKRQRFQRCEGEKIQQGSMINQNVKGNVSAKLLAVSTIHRILTTRAVSHLIFPQKDDRKQVVCFRFLV